MLIGLYIFYEDEFKDPIYADPDSEDLDENLWVATCESVQDALEGEGPNRGEVELTEHRVGWRTFVKMGVSFVAIVSDEVTSPQLEKYTAELSRRYFDEVDDAQTPDRPGVADIVVDVIPPWEDED